MNQSELNKLISKLEMLFEKEQCVYAITSYSVYPDDWFLLIRYF